MFVSGLGAWEECPLWDKSMNDIGLCIQTLISTETYIVFGGRDSCNCSSSLRLWIMDRQCYGMTLQDWSLQKPPSRRSWCGQCFDRELFNT